MESDNPFIKETTTTTVYNYIKKQIITGHFISGEWIREKTLKDSLGVSSTPIREALRTLVQEKLLVSIPHRGVQVRDFTKKEIKDFFELRMEIEGFAATLAAKRRTEQQLEEIKEMLKLSYEEDNKLGYKIINYNNQFHKLIAQASNNQAIVDIIARMKTEVDLLRVKSWNIKNERPIVTLKQHRLILEAIANQDVKEARMHMISHIKDSAKVLLRDSNLID